MRSAAALAIGVLIAATALVAAGYQWRDSQAQAELSALLLSAEQARDRQTAKTNKALADQAATAALLAQERARKNQVIEKEVIRYVEKTSGDNSCMLSTNWVQLHNAAASNSVPVASGASGIDAAAASTGRALETITDNYISCNDTRHQLLGLQQFIRTIYEQARP